MTNHQTITIWPSAAPGSETWTHEEVEFTAPFADEPTKQWRGIRNVVTPTLTIYKPAAGTANGAGMIVCPGGGFRLLAFDYEGTDIAEWLAARGITAFLLKYRVQPTPPDPADYEKENAQLVQTIFTDMDAWIASMDERRKLPVEDGVQALKVIRHRAAEFGVEPGKIGMMGFSAGGGVTIGTAMSDPTERPNFAAAIYGGDRSEKIVDGNAPPLFIAVSQNDPFRLAADNIRLYQRWIENGAAADLHVFSEGGHGYGMRKLGLVSDQWPILFERWLKKIGALSHEMEFPSAGMALL
jgi:acetyl esterase/lipase